MTLSERLRAHSAALIYANTREQAVQWMADADALLLEAGSQVAT